MAATEYIYLSGKSKWAKFTQPNKWGKYSCDLYMDQENIAKVKELKKKGLMNKVKMDDDGEHVTLSRPEMMKYSSGESKHLGPPIVLTKDNVPCLDTPVGNGSDLTCKMAVYGFGPKDNRKVAMRLEAVRIDNLVTFDASKHFTAEENKAVKGLPEQPEPLF